MPVEPFLEPAHGGDKLFGIHRDLGLDHAVDGHRPGVGHHLARLLPDVLRRPEFVEIGVGGGHLLVGQRAVELIGLVSRVRVAADGRHRGGRHQSGGGKPEAGEPGALQPGAAVHPDILRGGGGFRQLPAAAGADQHGVSPCDEGS